LGDWYYSFSYQAGGFMPYTPADSWVLDFIELLIKQGYKHVKWTRDDDGHHSITFDKDEEL